MLDDDFDEDLLRAIELSNRSYVEYEIPRLSQCAPSTSKSSENDQKAGPNSTDQSTSSRDNFKRPSLPSPQTVRNIPTEELYDGPEAAGFNFKAGECWIYPTSDKFPVRTYQRDIVEKALFNNTLVSLPTGLGKTFIAAVVMYNYYMWYPKGKIIFMAPTKPLVAQQIENCIDIMGIPESHTAEMTGAIHSKIRAVTWKEKRVFFLTPQVVQNDLSANICPANDVKCVVIDEAHRALGDHAYSQVIRLLNSYEARFRVLALSATPGSDLEAVQKVISNLMINHIELRSEESLDVAQYTHQRNVELMVVDVGPTINRIRTRYVSIASEYAASLLHRKLLFGNVSTISRFAVLREWESFRREGSQGMDQGTISRINCDFSIVHTLIHGLELLQTYGLRLLLNHLKGAMNGSNGVNKKDAGNVNVMNRLKVNEDLNTLMADIETILNPIEVDDEENGGENKKKFIYGHPKLDRLQEVVVSHFESFEKKGNPTRAIVFCEYREGVIEICDMLKHFEPLVKPVLFMGQSTGKTSKGISQKQQLEIMEKFRKGTYNTLISTSVGEEGLDIGEVDLIICFDAKNSPIRQVQRMGRTGRKREGRIIMLVTRGKEEQKYKQGLFKKKNVSAVLLSRDNLASHFFEDCPSMLPPGVQPTYTERKLVPTVSKPKSNQQDLRKMFLKRSAGSASGAGKPVNRPLGKLTCLSEEDFEDVKLMNFKFDRIPERAEFWSKAPDEISNPDLSTNNIDLGAYVEFLRYPQRTHVIGNSSESLLLSQLLSWADDRRDAEEGTFGAAFSSQVTTSQIWPNKQRKRGRPSSSDSKTKYPPKKRGRLKKDAVCSVNIETLMKSHDDAESDQSNQHTKRKSKPQYIEDDEEMSPTKPPMLKKSNPSVFLSPSKPVSPKQNTSVSVQEENITVLDSDDEVDLNSSTLSDFAGLSSQPSRQQLYSELSRALRNQRSHDEDDCDFCDTLFLCKSLNKMVLQRNVGGINATWKDIKKSLEDVKNLVPKITCDVLSKHTVDTFKPDYGSQVVLSLMPKLGLEVDDNIDGGMLCGGVGDLSPPEVFAPDHKDPQGSPKTVRMNSDISMKNHDKDGSATDTIASPCSTSKKKPVLNEDSYQHQFEDVSFDFLGLSNIDDMFGSSKNNDKRSNPALDDSSSHTEVQVQSPLRPCKLSFEPKEGPVLNESSPIMRKTIDRFSPMKVERSPLKPQENQLSTPTKNGLEIEQQLSPILCSQVSKKPRLALRRRKQSSVSENVIPKPQDTPMFLQNNSDKSSHKFPSEKQGLDDENVTSSSQVKATNQNLSPPEANFDIFDDDLFQLSDEVSNNKSKVDEDLKETIRARALMAKTPAISFTQELNNMCETTMGGLTQVLDMLDKGSKEKSTNLKIERADSSSSPLKPRSPASPANLTNDMWNQEKLDDAVLYASNASDEDMFAGCDDSYSCEPDSSIRESERQPVLLQEDKEQSSHISVLKNNVDYSVGVTVESTISNHVEGLQNVLDRSVCGENDDEESRTSHQCVSPILKSSQMVKRPSKLSLKKKKSESEGSMAILKSNQNEESRVQSEGIRDKKEIPATKIPKQPDSCSQIDFSMFGDEFNNSWLYSQNCDKNPVRISKEMEVTHCDKKSIPRGTMNISPKASNNSNQNSQTARGSTPENELDLAFAKLDERKTSLRFASSSTPRPEKKAQVKGTSFLVPRQTSEKEVITLSSSDDEEPIVKCKKGKIASLNITSSSEENFNQSNQAVPNDRSLCTSVVEKKRKFKALQSSSSNESLVGNGWISAKSNKVPRKENESSKNSKQASLLDLSNFCDESLLDALEDEEEKNVKRVKNSKQNANILSSDDEVFVEKTKKKTKIKSKKKTKKRRKGNGFILSEADESDDGVCNSSDGETTSLDELDSSFINDSQPDASQSVVDIHAKYLQSVRSPHAGAGRFKMPSRLPQVHMDVYSQYPDASELNQTYANDSFCVDTEATQYESAEMSLLEIAEAKLKARKKEKRKYKQKLKYGALHTTDSDVGSNIESDESGERVKVTKKRLRRIKPLEDSISADETENTTSDCHLLPRNSDPKKDSPVPASKASSSNKTLNNGNEIDDFAQLLDDDDIDFNFIPENPVTPPKATESPRPQHSKVSLFSKKVPTFANGVSGKENGASSWLSSSRPAGNSFIPPKATESPIPQHSKVGLFSKKVPTFANEVSSKENVASSWASTSRPAGNSSLPTHAKETSVAVCSSASLNHQRVANAEPSVQIFIIASSRQIASSTDLLRVLRTSHNVRIVPRAISEADFIISWRLGVIRIFVSDLKDRKKLEEQVKKLKVSFNQPYFIVEKDRIKTLAIAGFQKKKNKSKVPQSDSCDNPSSNCQSLWTSPSVCSNVSLLRQAGIHLLFSQDKDESAGLLAKLSKKETLAGHGIPEKAVQNESDEVESRLQFFSSLPGINLAFALKMMEKFHSLSDFLSRCSSVREIANTLGLDVDAARRIHNILCEVHVSP